jgi:hypothetical protein
MSVSRSAGEQNGPAIDEASANAKARAQVIRNTVSEFAIREAEAEDRTRREAAVSQMKAAEMGLRLTREALAEDPSNADLLYQLGLAVSDLTWRLENAGDLLGAEAVRLRPGDGFLLFALAGRRWRRGDLPRAEQALRVAVERLLDSSEVRDRYMAGFALLHLARALRDQEKDAEARSTYERVVGHIAMLREHGFSLEGLTRAFQQDDPHSPSGGSQ